MMIPLTERSAFFLLNLHKLLIFTDNESIKLHFKSLVNSKIQFTLKYRNKMNEMLGRR